jgi:hypothetical protein
MALTTTTTSTISKGYTIFITYGFDSEPYNNIGSIKSLGYSSSINCNYIQSRVVSTLTNKNVNLYFSSPTNFKFFADSGLTNGTGWTATKIYALIQIVNNNNFAKLTDVVPQANAWRKFDITNQISNLNAETIASTSFSIPLSTYSNPLYSESYTLDYLNYPAKTLPEIMAFGEETFFMGNVETEIQAIAYTTDISINLPLNQFNSSTNATWDGVSVVQISEVGIYDTEGNLVAIGKLNDPIGKDATIARTLVFGVDF